VTTQIQRPEETAELLASKKQSGGAQGPGDEMIRPRDGFEALKAKIKSGAVLFSELCMVWTRLLI